MFNLLGEFLDKQLKLNGEKKGTGTLGPLVGKHEAPAQGALTSSYIYRQYLLGFLLTASGRRGRGLLPAPACPLGRLNQTDGYYRPSSCGTRLF
jgi:hypothetical protein